tara:strand:+ start:3047 stop:3325 length:279 start_codon:yes stop_codon:yes gene_type:complete
MNSRVFNEIKKLPNSKILEEIISTEKKLFRLKFKKATQQQFKTHEIKSAKRTLKQLKSILTLRLNKLSELDRNNVAINLIQQQLLKEKSLNN